MPMRRFSRILSATALVVMASGAACKNDSGVTGPTSLEGQYKGTMAGESGPTPGGADGIWNTLLRGTSLSGVYDNVDGSDGYFTGTVNGSSVSITDISASPGATASGTISGTTMSGTLSGNGVVYATWTSDTSC